MRVLIVVILVSFLNCPLLCAQSGGGYDQIGKYESGRAKVKLNGLYGVIDLEGKEIISPKYEVMRPFVNNRSRVQ